MLPSIEVLVIVFVLRCSLPKSDSLLLSLLTNASVIAVFKIMFAKMVVPHFAHFLTRHLPAPADMKQRLDCDPGPNLGVTQSIIQSMLR